MKNNSPWKYLSKLYKEKFGVPEPVLSVMCVRTILTLCVSGLSNESIATFLNIKRELVDGYIKDTFKFDGWQKDLDYSPIHQYKTTHSCTHRNQEKFCKKFLQLYADIEPYYR